MNLSKMRCELYIHVHVNYLMFMYKNMNFMKILSHKNVYCTVMCIVL